MLTRCRVVSNWFGYSFIYAKVVQIKGLFLRKLVTDCYIIEQSHVVENIIYLLLPMFLRLFFPGILSSHLPLLPFLQRILKVLVVVVNDFIENKGSLISIRKQKLDLWDFSLDKSWNLIFVNFLFIQLNHEGINDLDKNQKIVLIEEKLN
jgi:hypothetical protein